MKIKGDHFRENVTKIQETWVQEMFPTLEANQQYCILTVPKCGKPRHSSPCQQSVWRAFLFYPDALDGYFSLANVSVFFVFSACICFISLSLFSQTYCTGTACTKNVSFKIILFFINDVVHGLMPGMDITVSVVLIRRWSENSSRKI